jgi:hypothetical protein
VVTAQIAVEDVAELAQALHALPEQQGGILLWHSFEVQRLRASLMRANQAA